MIGNRRGIKIFQIAVVPEIKRRPRMNEIGNEEIGVKVFCLTQARVARIRQQRVILKNGAERKLLALLVSPYRRAAE